MPFGESFTYDTFAAAKRRELDDAIEIIDGTTARLSHPRSWRKDASFGRDAWWMFWQPWDRMCLMNRLARVEDQIVGRSTLSGPARAALDAAVVALFPARVDFATEAECEPAAFNDHPDTTHADVIDVLQHARADLVRQRAVAIFSPDPVPTRWGDAS